jgi:hypothetical protein
MDPEILSSSAILIKRLSDSSAFITDSVVNSLMLMNQCVSFHRSHAALMTGLDNKNAVIRGQCMRLLLHLYQIRGKDAMGGSAEMETILKKLGKTARDTSPEARKYSRGLVKELIESELVPKGKVIDVLGEDLVKSSLRVDLSLTSTMTQRKPLNSSGLLNQTLQPSNGLDATFRSNSPLSATATALKRPTPAGANQGQSYGQGQGQSLSPSSSVYVPKLSLPKASSIDSSISLMVSGVSPRGAAQGMAQQQRSNHQTAALAHHPPLSKQQQEAIPELAALPSIFQSASGSKNWQERRESLTALCDLVIQHQELYERANKLEKCLELFLERFEDGSVKVIAPLALLDPPPQVILHSISCVVKIHHQCPSLLSKLLPISLPAVLGVESSANKSAPCSVPPPPPHPPLLCPPPLPPPSDKSLRRERVCWRLSSKTPQMSSSPSSSLASPSTRRRGYDPPPSAP